MSRRAVGKEGGQGQGAWIFLIVSWELRKRSEWIWFIFSEGCSGRVVGDGLSMKREGAKHPAEGSLEWDEYR